MFVSLSGCMGAESIQRFDRLHQHQRNIVPTVRLLVPSNGMDSYGRPPDEDHFWMADVEGLPTRHSQAKGSKRLGGDVFDNLSRCHHIPNLACSKFERLTVSSSVSNDEILTLPLECPRVSHEGVSQPPNTIRHVIARLGARFCDRRKPVAVPPSHDPCTAGARSYTTHYAPVAQLDRATVFGTVGYRFESCRVYSSLIV